MLFAAGFVFAIWAGLGVAKFFFSMELDEAAFRWLTWGRDFVFLSMLPYLARRIEGLKKPTP